MLHINYKHNYKNVEFDEIFKTLNSDIKKSIKIKNFQFFIQTINNNFKVPKISFQWISTFKNANISIFYK